MIGFTHRAVGSRAWACAGSAEYCRLADPAAGHCRVDHDSTRQNFRIARGERRKFKAWLASVAGPVRGAWPFYVIDTTDA